MRLDELISGLPVRLASPADGECPDLRVCDITEDSRTVMPGSLYIARRGEKADGRQFIPAAIAAGATAILTDDPALQLEPASRDASPVVLLIADDVPLISAYLGERFYGNPSSRLALIGVTGTNGKTTTTYIAHQILNALGVRCGLIGTVMIDDGTEVAPASMTTPPALEISRTLSRMIDAGCRAAVLEVSSHSLAQKRVAALSFDVGVFTNLTGDHLDYHGTMDAYADAKAELFSMLAPANEGGTAIVNADDPAWERMVRNCQARIWRTSTTSAAGAECSATIRHATRFHTDVELRAPFGGSGVFEMRAPMVGPHNVMNSLQAIAAVQAVVGGGNPKLGELAREQAIGPEQILAELARCGAPPGRLECVTTPSNPITVYVDYAHTDDALRTVLLVLRDVMKNDAAETGKLAVVFGCGGDRDATKRPRMGKVACDLADRIYITSDNPRTEDPLSIIDAVVSGMPARAVHDLATGRVVIEPDRRKAILRSIREARPGDVVIIAGKGHEDYQIVLAPPSASPAHDDDPPTRGKATVKNFFDDRLVAGEGLALRGIKSRPPVSMSREATKEAGDGYSLEAEM